MIRGTFNKSLPIQSTRERVIFSPLICSQVLLDNTENSYLWEGMMSQLVREAFAHAPEATFTLEATTPKSRDQYLHLGFEVTNVLVMSSPVADFSSRNLTSSFQPRSNSVKERPTGEELQRPGQTPMGWRYGRWQRYAADWNN